MPTYTYLKEDGERIEIFQKMTDEPLTKHPETGEPIKRIFAPNVGGMILRGEGFHANDYNAPTGR